MNKCIKEIHRLKYVNKLKSTERKGRWTENKRHYIKN